MGLATSGIYSGLDVESIISGLMNYERRPLLSLQKKEADYQAKISGLGSLLSSLSSLKSSVASLDASSIISMKASSSDTTVFSVTADSTAASGAYNININNIASSQSIHSAAFTAETDEVADLSVVTSQNLQIQVGTADPVTIKIDLTNNTLTGMRDAINNANAGVNASIVNDGTGYRLVLASTTTGTSNRIAVKVDEDDNGTYEEAAETDAAGLSRLAFNPDSYDIDGNPVGGVLNMTQSWAAKDASLTVNGLAVTSSSNTVNDVISGITLSLKKDSEGSTLTLSVSSDTNTIKTKINSLVSSYNSLVSTIKELRGSSTGKGTLRTDSVINAIYYSLRSFTSSSYSGLSLAELGISTDQYGVMSFDSTKFDSKLSEGRQSVIDVFDEMSTNWGTNLDDYIKTVIPDKQKGYTATIKTITKRAENIELRLSKTEKLLRKKFENLDQQLAQLQGQGSYITQLQSQLKSIGGSK